MTFLWIAIGVLWIGAIVERWKIKRELDRQKARVDHLENLADVSSNRINLLERRP